ncbi:MAG TPA: diacylglyceryl transferase, partial [Chitinophagaceae bacterium]|nr:diacylglyceryl transferase [Chitinophagaceae bacterium]
FLALVLFLIRKRLKNDGFLFSIYLIFNGLERFTIEKIRVNNQMNLFGFNPTQAEVISILLFAAGLILFWYRSKKNDKQAVR